MTTGCRVVTVGLGREEIGYCAQPLCTVGQPMIGDGNEPTTEELKLDESIIHIR